MISIFSLSLAISNAVLSSLSLALISAPFSTQKFIIFLRKKPVDFDILLVFLLIVYIVKSCFYPIQL